MSLANTTLHTSAIRWLKFNFVGAIGIGVQLTILYLLTALGINYLLATALAVEAAVLHNFLWHERFTWADRAAWEVGSHRARNSAARLLRFNLASGAISIAGNLLLMGLLVGEAHLAPVLANVTSISACSIANFLVSDLWVFRDQSLNSGPNVHGI